MTPPLPLVEVTCGRCRTWGTLNPAEVQLKDEPRRRLCFFGCFRHMKIDQSWSPRSSRKWMSVTSSFSTPCRMYLPVLTSMRICSPNDPTASSPRESASHVEIVANFPKSLRTQLCQDRLVCFSFDEIHIILWIQKHLTVLPPTYLAGLFLLLLLLFNPR